MLNIFKTLHRRGFPRPAGSSILQRCHLATDSNANHAGTISIARHSPEERRLWLRITVPATFNHQPHLPSIPRQTKPETCLLNVSINDTLSELLTILREEYPDLGAPRFVEHPSNTPGGPSSPLSNGHTLGQLFRGKIHGSFQFPRGLALNLDEGQILASLRDIEARHRALEGAVTQMESTHAGIARSVERVILAIKWTGLAYISGQLGAIIFLTQQLGWDLMEPVSYLASLSGGIFSATIYVLMKRDPEYTNIGTWVRGILRKRISRRRGFDEKQYETIKAQAESLKGVIS
ncbi:uncharacterized protein EV422DRAFT_562981 [Fimicolochytrium jonesii]|uniref:uncharacterized protein n=1 Tax=Fimicolochytrium jonesii TaxID=1396493 RepID=UPI0022FE60EB|nr:uncharacterized protein EV422DRAFT_562981 [Fimicolochytrium jonesii]KAI8826916.1 hypothetical protein EV422DRAFT_562981 [Fimicolochytrium jonesii]